MQLERAGEPAVVPIEDSTLDPTDGPIIMLANGPAMISP
jgi:hypothetical protein